MNSAPDIHKSTELERREYINSRFPCIADCDMCGLCKVFTAKILNTHMTNILKEYVPLAKYQKTLTDKPIDIVGKLRYHSHKV